MRNGQNNKRMRGRNNNNNNHHRKNQNPMSRVYESNGPDVKIRGNPSHIAEKYIQLARDAQSSGDPVSAENYYQHAEHYYRLIAAAQEQFRQNNPHLPRQESEPIGARDDNFDDEGDEDGQPMMGDNTPFGTREPQPFLPRDAQPYPPQQQPAPRHNPQGHNPQGHNAQGGQNSGQGGGGQGQGAGDIDRLPSFITGGQQPQGQQPQQNFQGNGQNGHECGGQPDRFPLHRRRRRHRGGPRQDFQGGGQNDGGESSPRD